jgi:hypothetical protein
LNLKRTEPEHIGASEVEQYKGRNNIYEERYNIQGEEQNTRGGTNYKEE